MVSALVMVGFVLATSMTKGEQIVTDNLDQKRDDKIRIATCPTGYRLIKGLNEEEYEVIRTSSTSESLGLLTSNQVDLVLAGRTLRLEEGELASLVIKDGYAILGKEEMLIYVDQLKDYKVCTDLESEVVSEVFGTEQVEQVDDVYMYLDEAIVITDWENVDYTRAELIHLLDRSGDRLLESRRMALYYTEKNSEMASKTADLVKKQL